MINSNEVATRKPFGKPRLFSEFSEGSSQSQQNAREALAMLLSTFSDHDSDSENDDAGPQIIICRVTSK